MSVTSWDSFRGPKPTSGLTLHSVTHKCVVYLPKSSCLPRLSVLSENQYEITRSREPTYLRVIVLQTRYSFVRLLRTLNEPVHRGFPPFVLSTVNAELDSTVVTVVGTLR